MTQTMMQKMIDTLDDYGTIFITSPDLDFEAWHDDDYDGYVANDNTAHDTAEDAIIYIVRKMGGVSKITAFAEDEWSIE